jgi:Tfp pilus assembly protein PilV
MTDAVVLALLVLAVSILAVALLHDLIRYERAARRLARALEDRQRQGRP